MKKVIVVTVVGGVAEVSTNIEDAEIIIYDFDDIKQGGGPLSMSSNDCQLKLGDLERLQKDAKMEQEKIQKMMEE